MSDNSNVPNIPLLKEWLNFSDGLEKNGDLLKQFAGDQLTAENVDVTGSIATALYSGKIADQATFLIAQDLAERSKTPDAPDGQIRIIDNTRIGRFLI